ncbi:MAG: hypothetical protein A3F91_09920 [Flavobacteria bacterium RIFCSPLOWO2_12_FULL_35_11]|nr:MAG: hypothetical protein A3F91_09920 [Flavobacteria bacterium RIFCSPLOWO2_12_FULL_35_11]
MSTTLKTSFVMAFVLQASLQGGFIEGIVDKAKSSAASKFTPDNISGMVDKYKEYGIEKGASGVSDYIFSDSGFSAFWSNNTSFATGTMELCYTYSPRKKNPVNGDICSLLKDTSADPCSLLPNTVGDYKKTPKKEKDKIALPFEEWCREYTGKVKKVATDEASKMMGLSGKTKAEAKGAKFNSDENSKFASTVDNFIANAGKHVFSKNAVNDPQAAKINALKESGNEHVYANEIKRLAKNNPDVTMVELQRLADKPVFDNITEYRDDLNMKANSDSAIYRQLFDPHRHLDIVSAQFSSMNQQKKGLKDKREFIEQYVEDKDTGLRKQYRIWAENVTESEVMYELPDKLGGKYKVFFETDRKSREGSKPGAIAKMNNDIVKQAHMEEQVMLRWRMFADEKADEIKTKMLKSMYASEVFDESAARAQIAQMMSVK